LRGLATYASRINWINCNVCDIHISLIDPEEQLMVTRLSLITKMDRTADARRELEAGLVSAAGEIQVLSFTGWAGSSRTTLALVFTDIVGSTALNMELGNEQMSRVRRAHLREARIIISNYKGYEIKTIGDSLMVVFRTATEALDFALALSTNTGHSKVRIRVGIHVGAIQIEEDDAFGSMVNYTARVESQAEGAEIWVSERAKKDIDEEKAEAHNHLSWTEHNDCELKGFSGKHILWSVIAPEKRPDIKVN
jgi:adenylate cyclase